MSFEKLPKIKEINTTKNSGKNKDLKISMGDRMAVKMNKIGSKGFYGRGAAI